MKKLVIAMIAAMSFSVVAFANDPAPAADAAAAPAAEAPAVTKEETHTKVKKTKKHGGKKAKDAAAEGEAAAH